MVDGLMVTLGISLLIQAGFFAFAVTLKTDKVTDLSYGLTFVLIAGYLLWQSGEASAARLTLAAMVAVWGIRLAGYLLFRIIHMGRDVRFDGIREHFWPFFKFWFGQGVAVWVIMLPVTVWFAGPDRWTPLMSVGGSVWLIGLVIETVADAQKFAFKRQAHGKDRWMSTGVWKYSRHPNYFGELLCWWGVFVFVAGNLTGRGWLSVIGPLAITYILLFVTGIPTLEASANRKWADDPEYQAHLRRTSRLIPWPPSAS